MKKATELTIYDVENWAKEVENYPRRAFTEEEVGKLMHLLFNESILNKDEEVVRLLDEKQGGMASVIWLRINHCHTYKISPTLAIYLGEIITNFGESTMMCNYLQYMAYKNHLKVITLREWGLKIFPNGYISEEGWKKAWELQKIETDREKGYNSDNMLDYSGCYNSIKDIVAESPEVMVAAYDLDTEMPDNTCGVTESDYKSYWKDKKGYCDYEYDEMYESKHGMSPRGDWYNLVLVRNGKIIAFGDEQGNYAGGIYCANDCQYQRFLKEKERIKREYPDLYEKIKDIPLAEENEYPMYKKNGKR